MFCNACGTFVGGIDQSPSEWVIGVSSMVELPAVLPALCSVADCTDDGGTTPGKWYRWDDDNVNLFLDYSPLDGS